MPRKLELTRYFSPKGETLEEAAHRILAEKISVNNLYLEQLYTFGNPGRDPREAPDQYGVRYLSVSYFALIRYGDAALMTTNLSHVAGITFYRFRC